MIQMMSSYGSRRRRMAALLWMCLLPGVAASSSSSSAAPWQSNSGTSVLEQEEYRDLGPTVFSPGGRLHSVERIVAAASSLQDTSSNLVVALTCREGVVLVTTCNTSPHLDIITNSVDHANEDETAVTALWMPRKGRQQQHVPPISRIAPQVFMVTGGNAVDSCILREKITRMAEATRQEQDGGMPLAASFVSCAALARRVSDHLQLPTQTLEKAGRILASYAVLIGRDDHSSSPCLWRIDPTGQFWKCHATAIGRGSTAAEVHLMGMLSEKDVSDVSWCFSNLSTRQALSIARECIEKTLPKEPTTHWQALLLRKDDGKQMMARVLHGNEIHAFLNSTAEPDATS